MFFNVVEIQIKKICSSKTIVVPKSKQINPLISDDSGESLTSLSFLPPHL